MNILTIKIKINIYIYILYMNAQEKLSQFVIIFLFSGISFFIIQQFFKYVKVTEVEIKEENGEKVIIEGFFYNIVAIPMNLIIFIHMYFILLDHLLGYL